MHVHLVNFQVLNRQPIDAAAYQTDHEKWIDGDRKAADKPVPERPPAPASTAGRGQEPGRRRTP